MPLGLTPLDRFARRRRGSNSRADQKKVTVFCLRRFMPIPSMLNTLSLFSNLKRFEWKKFCILRDQPLFKQSRTMCVAVCASESFCLTAVYNNQNGLLRNCFLYNRYFSSSELVSSSTSTFYQKKQISDILKGSFLDLFTSGVNTLMFSNINPVIQNCLNIEKTTINNLII